MKSSFSDRQSDGSFASPKMTRRMSIYYEKKKFLLKKPLPPIDLEFVEPEIKREDSITSAFLGKLSFLGQIMILYHR